ncbi:IS30 family transposase [Segeticoccus rhizosphaerae]|uniref:IS30 family transposase n=1 Tax=Segeticoccus rhizosphaerae TaxID=1104777 RepID=UPI001EE49921|nr:IS30 family transposase [Ornithinicoccus soli]
MRSPGRPEPSRAVQRAFWRLIAQGLTSEDAGAEVGVSTPVATRWFRHAGGMTPISLNEPTGRCLSFAEREEIALLRAQDHGVREIARRIGRDPSTISRELRRNAATRADQKGYRATVAQWKVQQAAKRPKPAKLATNRRLREYVEHKLAGEVTDAEGRPIAGPNVPWVGRRQGRRRDRRWGVAWSPEQISNRLKVDFPDDESMRVSHETIYQSLYVQGRGALKRELTACLRSGRALREPRARTGRSGRTFVTDDVKISQRPAEAEDRAVPGHWEGDLIIGLERSAIGTLVERTSRYTMLLHLPRMEDFGKAPTVKNGPPLAGRGAEAVNAAIVAQIGGLPEQLRRSLTWDQGGELAKHVQLKIDAGIEVYFCDPHSPWQRPSNENTNGLLRQYFPKGTDLSRWTAEELQAVVTTLNARPRKTLGWRTPAEVYQEQLSSLTQAGVASTP